jgi:hypothetical protein
MAQTRAQAKALKGPFSWIVAMSGYASAAAEEGAGADEGNDAGGASNIRPPQQKSQQDNPTANGQESPKKITDKQASRIWALAHAANKPNEEVAAILKHFGFESAKDVTPNQYDAVCAEVQKGDAQQ